MIAIISLFLLLVLLFYLLYKKYTKLYVLETPEMYREKILPYLNKVHKENTKWMFDLLDNKTDQTIYSRTPNFLVCKDIKWSTNKIEDCYLLAIPDEKIMTIRDLRQKHIPLLESMKDEMIRVASRMNIHHSDLVFFFHYMPSIYQLHLHCCLKTNPRASDLRRGIYFYESVVGRLRLDNYYWKNATMRYSLSVENRMCIDLYLK